MMSGCLLLLTFSVAMPQINPGEEAIGVALMFMACFSVGITETCSLALAPLELRSEDIGAALGALGSIRSGMLEVPSQTSRVRLTISTGGAAVATAIYVSILNNKLAQFVPEHVTLAALGAGLPPSSMESLYKNPDGGKLNLVPGMTPSIIAAVGNARAWAAAEAFR